MTSSAPFRRFSFAFGTTFAVLYVVALAKDLALITVFPSLGIILAGTHRSRDVADPAMGFLALRFIGTDGPRRPHSGHWWLALSLRPFPKARHDTIGKGWCG
jgi:hypothetical protein